MRSIIIIATFALLAWALPYPIHATNNNIVFVIDYSLSTPKITDGPEFYKFVMEPKYQKPILKKKITYNKTKQMLTKRITRFAPGYCTDYVARKVPVTWSGNANRWVYNASNQGYTVNKIPQAGAILVTSEGPLGHVAYIESVSGNKIQISEWNYSGLYKTTVRTLDINSKVIKGIIHL